jgi:hypothetical protein
VLNGMVVAMVMMIVGSNIARAFSLVGALSIIRFRNAVKETRDVGFIFFTMAIGMAIGTKFYLLAVVAAVVISLVILLMTRFNWYERQMASQILRVQVPNGVAFDTLFDPAFLQYTSSSELISVDLGPQRHADRAADLQHRHEEGGPDPAILERDQEFERQQQGDVDCRVQQHRSIK